MPLSGLFITLYDEATLRLYLDRGVYGFLMRPLREPASPQTRHYHALADYSCLRGGGHIFFFLKRRIIYGGQALGPSNTGAFYLNGETSSLGKLAEAPLAWDESKRPNYSSVAGRRGVFLVPVPEQNQERCQPYLLRFQDRLSMKGRTIRSDQLYWRLGDYGFPLPSNSIQGMGLCTLTPREVEIALSLLQDESCGQVSDGSDEKVKLECEPTPFRPGIEVSDLGKAFSEGTFVNEAHLEATVLADPDLLPAVMRPGPDDVLCRQVPISPFKPSQMDRADICYYSSPPLAGGALPSVVIELKKQTAGQRAVSQVERYLDWMYRILPPDEARRVQAYILAPRFSRSSKVQRYREQICLVTPD